MCLLVYVYIQGSWSRFVVFQCSRLSVRILMEFLILPTAFLHFLFFFHSLWSRFHLWVKIIVCSSRLIRFPSSRKGTQWSNETIWCSALGFVGPGRIWFISIKFIKMFINLNLSGQIIQNKFTVMKEEDSQSKFKLSGLFIFTADEKNELFYY